MFLCAVYTYTYIFGSRVTVEVTYSTERGEETMVSMDGYRTMTLDLKRRNKASVPLVGDGDDRSGQGGMYGGQNGGGQNGGGDGGMYNGTDVS